MGQDKFDVVLMDLVIPTAWEAQKLSANCRSWIPMSRPLLSAAIQ